jgi:hypothetical protein
MLLKYLDPLFVIGDFEKMRPLQILNKEFSENHFIYINVIFLKISWFTRKVFIEDILPNEDHFDIKSRHKSFFS